MLNIKKIVIGTAIAGTLGFAAMGVGSGIANAAPSPLVSQTGWAEHPGGPGPGWGGPGGGPGWHNGPGWNNGPGWGPPPPPPPPYYGYGGYDGYGGPGGCVTGPLGLLHFCN